MRGWLLLLLAGAGCATGPAGPAGLPRRARRGEQRLEIAVSYGIPDDDRVLWWDSVNEAPNAGLSVLYGRFLRDRLALLAGGTPVRIYDQDGDAVWLGEIQLGLRFYAWARGPVAFYLEGLGGLALARRRIPPDGTKGNFTADLGLGVEYPLDDRRSLVAGYRISHLSNGRGNVSTNPGQDDHELYVGFAWRW